MAKVSCAILPTNNLQIRRVQGQPEEVSHVVVAGDWVVAKVQHL